MSASTAYSDSPTPQPQSYLDAPSTSQTTTIVAASSSSATTAPPSQPQTRHAAEVARKDRTLAEFLLMLDDYEPLVSPIPSPHTSQLTPHAPRSPTRSQTTISKGWDSTAKMSACEQISFLAPPCVPFIGPPFREGNDCSPLLLKNSSPTSPRMRTNMLAYVRMRRVGGLARL